MKEQTVELIADLIPKIALFVFLLLVIIFAPLASIAALNTLFSLNIAYSFWTWLSMVWVCLVMFGGRVPRN